MEQLSSLVPSNLDLFSRRFCLAPGNLPIRIVSSWHYSEIPIFIFILFWILGLLNLLVMLVLGFGPEDIAQMPILYKIWGILVSTVLLGAFSLFLRTFFQTLIYDFMDEEIILQISSPFFKRATRTIKFSEFSGVVLRPEKIVPRQVLFLNILKFILPFMAAPSYPLVLLELEHSNSDLTIALAAHDNPGKADLETLHLCGQEWAKKICIPYSFREKSVEVALPSHLLRRSNYAQAIQKKAQGEV
ncbi:MAG: hypothetical protein EOM80_09190 [Erysipelotrichia bacterium]|nr:hypothetical protein [Erysipelotrichia bacterium]